MPPTEQNQAQILAFITEYFAWAQDEHLRRETCDRQAFVYWQCCEYHRQALREYEHFREQGKVIEDQFPTFHEDGNGKADYYPGIVSQNWFLQLSKVAGIPLPETKPPSWEGNMQ
jgi:hypothetical protein